MASSITDMVGARRTKILTIISSLLATGMAPSLTSFLLPPARYFRKKL